MKYILLFLILITGCAPLIRVRVHHDLDFSTHHYDSYSWCTALPPPQLPVAKRYHFPGDDQIKDAVNKAMHKKGYILADTCAALELHYHVIIEDKNMTPTPTYDYENLSLWVRSEEDPEMYSDGTWILDMVDVQTGHIVWRTRAPRFFKKTTNKTLEQEVYKALRPLPARHASGDQIIKQSIARQ